MASGYQSAELCITVHKWLKELGIRLPKAYIQEELATHPDYPSLIALSDCLHELRIPHQILKVQKEQLLKLHVPYLAHFNTNGGGVRFIDHHSQVWKIPGFFEQWSGIVAVAQKPEEWQHKENDEKRNKEKKEQLQKNILLSVLIIAAILSFAGFYSWQWTGLLFTSIIGLCVGLLIVQKDMGIYNPFTEQLCGANGKTGCETVIKSSKKKDFIGLLAEAPIIWFGGFILLLVTQHATWLPMLALVTIPVTLLSLYYQWRVIKSWCRLCLVTIALLWMQAVLLLPGITHFNINTISVSQAGITIFILTAAAFLWLLVIKPHWQQRNDYRDRYYRQLRFKNNPGVFKSLLLQQQRLDVSLIENELQLGNPDASVQIIAACNPYCGPCAVTHEALHDLVDKNDVGFTIKLTVKADQVEDPKTQAVAYLLSLLHGKPVEYRRRAIHDWYKWMDLEKFKQAYPLHEPALDITEQLEQHERWINLAQIVYTPTIFVNERRLPEQYRAHDLKWMVRELKNVQEMPA